jgi:hypothetical protein
MLDYNISISLNSTNSPFLYLKTNRSKLGQQFQQKDCKTKEEVVVVEVEEEGEKEEEEEEEEGDVEEGEKDEVDVEEEEEESRAMGKQMYSLH